MSKDKMTYFYDPIEKVCRVGSIPEDVEAVPQTEEGGISVWRYCKLS